MSFNEKIVKYSGGMFYTTQNCIVLLWLFFIHQVFWCFTGNCEAQAFERQSYTCQRQTTLAHIWQAITKYYPSNKYRQIKHALNTGRRQNERACREIRIIHYSTLIHLDSGLCKTQWCTEVSKKIPQNVSLSYSNHKIIIG